MSNGEEKVRDLMAQLADIKEHTLFFLGGVVKSGTTWIERILDAHPHIACKGEAHFMSLLEPRLEAAIAQYNAAIPRRGNWLRHAKEGGIEEEPAGYSYLNTELDFLLRQSILLMMRKWMSPEIRCVGEKTPDNGRHFQRLQLLFPGARFIYVIRDIRDVIVSGWFFNLNVNADSFRQHFPSIADYAALMAGVWHDEVVEALKFVATHESQSMFLRYEDMRLDPQGETRNLYQFLGAENSDSFVQAGIGQTDFSRLSGGRRHGEENRQSFYRKGVVGDWRNHLDDRTVASVVDRCGALMQALGYD